MKRDMELVRKLLMFFDDKPDGRHVEIPPIEGYDDATIKYHLILLYDAGFLRCEPVTSSSSDRVIYVLPFELTWNGHEFLDKARNQHIWDEVMDQVKQRGLVAASADILKRMLDAAVRKRLGLD